MLKATTFRTILVSAGVQGGRPSVLRECPFCHQKISDDPGKDINFIVHMGLWTSEHQLKREWADYIHNVNLRIF
jgi:hypothetical protein